jgi:branched-chain amino acid transport system permease protein
MTLRLSAGLALSVLVAAAVAAVCTSPYIADVASYAVVLALFAVAVGLVYGQLGYVSFGHAAFLGIGAYTVGLLVAHTGLSYWLLVPAAIVPGLLLGALVGLASVRVGGAYFAIATLTLAEMLRLIALDWTAVTRGPMGLMVMVPPLPWTKALGWSAQQGYLFILVVVLGAVLSILARLIAGPLGRRWTMIRQAPALAESIGIPTVRSRVVNVALSGAIASLAGGLLIPKAMVLSPDLFGTPMSAAGLLSVILGGKATLLGPVIGGLVFGALPEALRAVDEYRLGVFAVLLLLAVRLLPNGVVSLLPRRRAALPSPIGPAAQVDSPASLLARSGATIGEGRAALEVDALTKRFGGLTAIKDVSFRVQPRELVGLIGPNGAGKTTCLSMLSGFLRPSNGSIALDGAPIRGLPPSAIAARGLVRTFQQSACCPQLTVEQNVLHACHLLHPERPWAGLVQTAAYRAREASRLAHARRCIDAVGLRDRAGVEAGTLPYGEQKLLGVAIALAAQPDVLLLDEPAAGLNHTEGLRLGGVLERLNREGCTIVVVDHNLALLMSICQRLVVFQHGEKIADGSPQTIAADERVLAAYLGVTDEPVPAGSAP